jgi:hypothetical protein
VHLQNSISDEKIKLCSLRDVSQQRRSTGSIMPYIGLLRQQAGHCVVVLPSTATVLAMVGNRAPNLNGMFF